MSGAARFATRMGAGIEHRCLAGLAHPSGRYLNQCAPQQERFRGSRLYHFPETPCEKIRFHRYWISNLPPDCINRYFEAICPEFRVQTSILNRSSSQDGCCDRIPDYPCPNFNGSISTTVSEMSTFTMSTVIYALGFIETNEWEDDEIVARLSLAKVKDR